MATIHLIEGPVGVGKSTFAGRMSVSQGLPLLNLDEWMVNLFSPDRPSTDFMAWYAECKQRCLRQIWLVATELIETGHSVILELGLVQRNERQDFYDRVDAAGYELKLYVLDAPKALRKQRVLERNEQQGSTFRMTVSEEIFELADRAWEPLHEDEYQGREIQFIDTAPSN